MNVTSKLIEGKPVVPPNIIHVEMDLSLDEARLINFVFGANCTIADFVAKNNSLSKEDRDCISLLLSKTYWKINDYLQ